jgi:hypothetical protein
VCRWDACALALDLSCGGRIAGWWCAEPLSLFSLPPGVQHTLACSSPMEEIVEPTRGVEGEMASIEGQERWAC